MMEQESPCDRITKITDFFTRAQEQLDIKLEAAHSKTKKWAVIRDCKNLWDVARKSILTALDERNHPCSTPEEVHNTELLKLRAITEDFRDNHAKSLLEYHATTLQITTPLSNPRRYASRDSLQVK